MRATGCYLAWSLGVSPSACPFANPPSLPQVALLPVGVWSSLLPLLLLLNISKHFALVYFTVSRYITQGSGSTWLLTFARKMKKSGCGDLPWMASAQRLESSVIAWTSWQLSSSLSLFFPAPVRKCVVLSINSRAEALESGQFGLKILVLTHLAARPQATRSLSLRSCISSFGECWKHWSLWGLTANSELLPGSCTWWVCGEGLAFLDCMSIMRATLLGVRWLHFQKTLPCWSFWEEDGMGSS